jgi:glucose/arabinose dehydrogenase
MTSSELATFLIGYAAIACLGACLLPLRAPLKSVWAPLTAAIAALAAAVAVASWTLPGANSLVQLAERTLSLDRTHAVALASAVLCGGLAAAAIQGSFRRRWALAGVLGLYLASVTGLGLLAAKDSLTGPSAAGAGLLAASAPPGFRVEEFAKLGIAPTSICVGEDGTVFVAGFAGLAYQNGVVVRLEKSEAGALARERTVADYLNRPHGIAVWGGDLYVSRAGQFSKAVGGRIVQQDTGCVTRLRDLDGDGVFDHYEDVISGLPGAQQPDGLHQNNAVVFDRRGRLYVGVGVTSDHGPVTHEYSGAILRSLPDGSELEVFASGLRNPFGLAFGPRGELFCTDNDAAVETGDELNHVRQGLHYGHPYDAADRQTKVAGIEKPLLTFESAQGIAYVPPKAWPAPYDDSLYVANFATGQIRRVRVKANGDRLAASDEPFVSLPDIVALAVAPDGAMFACSYSTRKVYRITPVKAK